MSLYSMQNSILKEKSLDDDDVDDHINLMSTIHLPENSGDKLNLNPSWQAENLWVQLRHLGIMQQGLKIWNSRKIKKNS